MMLYTNIKAKVRSPDGNTDFFDIVAGVLRGDTFALYLFIIYLDNILRTSIDPMKENGFTPKKARSRRRQTMLIILLLANTHIKPGSQLHSLEQGAGGIGLHVNSEKTKYTSFNHEGDISTLKDGSLKLVDKFTYLGSSVSSTESDINMRQAKAWSAIDRLSIIWKSDLSDKIKGNFFKAAIVSILLYGCTTWTLKKTYTEKIKRELHKKATRYIEQILGATSHKIVAPILPSISKTTQVRWTRHAENCGRSKDELISNVL